MENCRIINDFCAAWPQLSLDVEYTCQVPATDLVVVANWWREAGARLLDGFALADPDEAYGYLLRYVFDAPGMEVFITLLSQVSGTPPTYPSVGLVLHSADWFEREIFEMYGIVPEGHPALGGFILRSQDPTGAFPLRKDFKREDRLSEVSGFPRPHPVLGRGVFEMPLGPVYAGVTESVHFGLASIGEEVFWVTPQLFFKHRGLEKAAEDIPLEGVLEIVRRISGIGAVSDSLALCHAVEKAAGVEVPTRALYIRSLLAELERLYNHIGTIADICESTSLTVGAAQGFMLRERLLRLNCLLTGSRYLMNTVNFGGVLCDFAPDRLGLLRETLKAVGKEFQFWVSLLLHTDSFLDRLENIGVLEPQHAANLGATGPVGRASGVDYDFRRDHAYAAYDQVEFRVPVEKDGDGLARFKLWAAEVDESLAIIGQLASRLPAGPPQNRSTIRLAAGASATGYSEGPRGTVLYWIFVGEDNRLWRMRLRPPSLLNWHCFPQAIEGCAFQDFPIILASFGLSLAETDR